MSAPDPKHIEAVATALREAFPDWSMAHATALLTSTDPLVLDALQDALVRAGRLTEWGVEWGVRRPEPYEGVLHAPTDRASAKRISRRMQAEHPGTLWPVVSRTRLVTDWQEA